MSARLKNADTDRENEKSHCFPCLTPDEPVVIDEAMTTLEKLLADGKARLEAIPFDELGTQGRITAKKRKQAFLCFVVMTNECRGWMIDPADYALLSQNQTN